MDDNMSKVIVTFRDCFSQMPPELKRKEFNRLKRVLTGRSAILITELGSDRPKRFNTITDTVRWLQNNGVPKASSSNVYKVLKKERSSAYGYLIEYEQE